MRILLILAVMVGMSYADDGHVHCGGEYHACCCCECYDYQVFCPDPGLTREAANVYCKGLPGGLGLATIDSEDTFNKIRAMIPDAWKGSFCGWGFWIGLMDETTTDPHDDAATFEAAATWEIPMCSYYYEWSDNEPNDNHNLDDAGQNCVQMWYRRGNDGRYDDEYCDVNSHKHGFVCQIELDCPCDECHPYDKDMAGK